MKLITKIILFFSKVDIFLYSYCWEKRDYTTCPSRLPSIKRLAQQAGDRTNAPKSLRDQSDIH